jgi:hypothetical protein
MLCDYEAREIEGEPYKVLMHCHGELASANAVKPEDDSAEVPEICYHYFHDITCYELFVAEDNEYEATGLPGSEIG